MTETAVLSWRWPNPTEFDALMGDPVSTLVYCGDEAPNEVLKREAELWYHQPDRSKLPAPTLVDISPKEVGEIAKWADKPVLLADAVTDHETNPEYELHVGQVTQSGMRAVSIWLRGERWSGWLTPGRHVLSPDSG